MNPKIDKLARDIEKTEKKIADLQNKLAEFLKAHRAGTLTIPEAAPPAGEQEAGHEE